MARIRARRLLGVLAFVAAATVSTRAIVGGGQVSQTDYQSHWPFAAAVEVILNGQPAPLCGGSLISAEWVLTAGHCTTAIENEFEPLATYGGTQVRIGNTDRTLVPATAVNSIVTHPLYDRLSSEYDFGLLHLASPVVDTPVVLATMDPAIGSAAKVAGWGVADGSQLLTAMRAAPVTIVARTALYLLAQDGSSSLCVGDSGGPLMNAANQQVGVASFSVGGACAAGDPGGYAKVSRLLLFLDDIGIPYNTLFSVNVVGGP